MGYLLINPRTGACFNFASKEAAAAFLADQKDAGWVVA
jgi:hypothetical protein